MKYTIAEARKIVEDKIKRLGFTLQYRKVSISGVVFYKSKLCIIPHIKSRASLYIAIHELYHCLRERKTKVYINEFKAEKFAHRYMRHLGFNVPRKQSKRAKGYIAYKLRKAFNRGLRQDSLDREVKNYLE